MNSDRMRVLRTPSLSETVSAVEASLAGGRAIAPLPSDPMEAERALRMLQPDHPVTEPDVAAIVSTSGSTGVPKGVVLSRTALRASAEATHRRLGGPGRWLLALPTHYVAGLMVVVRAIAAGQPVDDIGADLSGLADALDRGPAHRSYLSLVPTQLSRALTDPALIQALTRVHAILLGGAPAPPELLHAARDHGITVITTYGMSETCGGCVYDGLPLPGTDITLSAEGSLPPQTSRRVDAPVTPRRRSRPDHLSPQDDDGRILIGGPTVFSGYRLRPDLTEQGLVGGRVRTNDRGSWQDGRLVIHGRFDDVIISGGLKIDMAAVERAARDWPDLAGGEIAIIGIPDPDWGTRLVAVAESTRAAGELTLDGLIRHVADRLARHERPKELITVAELPRTSSGKIDRQQLSNREVTSAPTRREMRGGSDPSTDGERG